MGRVQGIRQLGVKLGDDGRLGVDGGVERGLGRGITCKYKGYEDSVCESLGCGLELSLWVPKI